MNYLFLVISLLSLSLALFSCSREQVDQSKAIKSFAVKGVIIEIQDEGRTVVIDHEEMPGYMGAMIMPFRVKNPAEVAGVSPGDEIQFTYQVAELSSWIEDLKTTGKKVEVNSAAPKSTSSSKLLKVGDPLPDFELLDEQGEPIQLSDYRGSIVALTFVFTRCPVPEYCPTMMRNFHEVDELLKADSESPENYQLLTVSFDPEFDTPEVLKAYAEPFKQNSSNWDLLSSSSQASVKSLGEAVGLIFGSSKSAIYSHNLRTVVLDESGKITKIFTDETWKPQALVDEIKNAAGDSHLFP